MISQFQVRRDEPRYPTICFLYSNENDKKNIKIGRNSYWDCKVGIDAIYTSDTIYGYYAIGISIRYLSVQSQTKERWSHAFPLIRQREALEKQEEETSAKLRKSWSLYKLRATISPK